VLNVYRPLLALLGPGPVTLSFVARIAAVPASLGALLLISTTTDSFGLGGTATGCIAVGTVIGGPLIGALADRRGHRYVVAFFSAVNGVTMVALAIAALSHLPTWLLLGNALLIGLTTPQIGALARVRWVSVIGQRPDRTSLVATAMAFEGVVDELAFVAGPAVFSALTLLHPAGALIGAGLSIGACGTLWALHRTAPAAPSPSARLGKRTRVRTVAVIAASTAALGLIVGGLQAITVRLAEEQDRPSLAGALLAVYAITSALAGVVTGMLPQRWGIGVRLRWVGAGAVAVTAPLLLVHDLGWLLLAGSAVSLVTGPYLITAYQLLERVVPQARLSAASALLGSSVVVGVGSGTAAGSWLAQGYGFGASRVLPLAAAVVLAAVALSISAGIARRSAPHTELLNVPR
jgi:MFS family permease